MDRKSRLESAAGVMGAQGADALLVTGLTNIRYLSGFTGSDGALLLTGDTTTLLCDSRYTLQAGFESAPWCDVSEYKAKIDGIATLISSLGCQRLAIDGEKASLAFYNQLVAALPGLDFVILAGELDQLRSIKSAAEIAAVEQAAGLAAAAFRQVLGSVRAGVSERFLAIELEMAMKKAGSDDKAFDLIVASGERSAFPHGRPTDRLLQRGELVTFDFGAVVAGYNSDETVTVAVGRPENRLIEIYGIVKEAHDRAIAALKPGIDCSALDAVARDYIDSCGFGDCFGHGLGHGVGLEVHEKPVISPRSQQQLREGMIVTIEPGIYVPGLGGVRIEDLLVVTADGFRVLSGIDKELIFC